jgi:hypothetical protein
VAPEAVALEDARVPRADDDRFMEILKSEALRMAVAVVGFSEILGDQIMGQVAIHADGRGVVAGFLPGIILRPHDVAIHAGFGVFAEIRKPLGISEGEQADPGPETGQDGKNEN